MKIKSVRLRNFCQHVDSAFEFTNGITGIIGRNGAGKSNIFAAIIYALTGSTVDPLDSYIRRDALPSDVSSVELVISSDLTGKDVRITRKLRPRSITLYTTEGVQIKKVKEADQYLHDVFGLDIDILRNIQIVPQEEVVSYFRLPPSTRYNLLSRIFGIWILQKRRDMLRDFMSGIRSVSSVKQQMEMLIGMKEEKERALEVYKDLPDSFTLQDQMFFVEEQKKEAERIVSSYVAYRFAKEQLDKARKQVSDTESEIIRETQSYTGNTSLSFNDTIASLVDESKKLVGYQSSGGSLASSLEGLMAKMDSIRPAIESLSSVDFSAVNDYNPLTQELYSLERQIKEFEPFIKEGTCPTCHRPYPEAKTKYEALKQERDALATRVEYAKEHYDSATDLRRIIVSGQDALFHYCSSLSSYATFAELKVEGEALANSLNPDSRFADPVYRVSCLEKFTDYYDNIQVFYISVKAKLENIAEQLRKNQKAQEDTRAAFNAAIQHESKLSSLNYSLEVARNNLASIEVAPILQNVPTGDEEAAKKRVTECESRIKFLNEQKAQLSIQAHILQDITSLQKQIEQLNTRVERDADLAEFKGDLDQVLDLLHPDKLPRMAVLGMSKAVVENINTYLSMFNADFTVNMEPTTDLYCTFQNGNVQAAWRLSGGQKVILALAWRLALHSTFATEESCGFLTLDEPTTFLDEVNIDNLSSVISQLRDLALKNNIQILVVTHEQSLSPLFDNVIQL